MNAIHKTIVASLIVFIATTVFSDPIQIADGEYLLGYGSMEDWDVTANGRFFVAGGSRGAFFWDLQNDSAPIHMNGHTDGVRAVAVSPDGSQILSGGRDRAVVLWDVKTGTELQRFTGHTRALRKIAFFRDGERILTATENTLYIWNARTGDLIDTIEFEEIIMDFSLFDDSRRIFMLTTVEMSGDQPFQDYAFVYDLEEKQETAFLDTAVDFALFGSITPNNDAVVLNDQNGDINVYDSNTGEYILQIDTENRTNHVTVTADGRNVVASDSKGRLVVYDYQTGVVQKTVGSDENRFILNRMISTPIGLLLGLNQSRVALMDIQSESIQTLVQGFIFADSDTKMALSPNADRLIVGTNLTTTVWDLTTYECLRTFDGEILLNNSVAFTPDRSRIMTVHKTLNVIRVWDYDTGELLLSKPCEFATQKQAALSPDGKTAVFPLEQNQIAVFNVDDGEKLFELSTGYNPGYYIPFQDSYHAMLFTPDGTKLFYVNEDKTVHVRSLDPNADVQSYMVH